MGVKRLGGVVRGVVEEGGTFGGFPPCSVGGGNSGPVGGPVCCGRRRLFAGIGFRPAVFVFEGQADA